MTPQALCDQNAQKFKELLDISQVKPDDFIRTSEERHHTSVKEFWNTLARNNYITMGSHEGYYSINDEWFYTPKDLLERQNDEGEIEYFTQLGEKVEWITEQNYLFKFDSATKQAVRDWLNSESNPVKPEYVKTLSLKNVENLKDKISISRPKKRIHWGIRVPSDEEQTVYVWLDALTNYKTVLDNFKGFDGEMIHVIGKDITLFHWVYWPAFLHACEYPLPREVIVHGHWTKDNLKMSKSLGNVVDPIELIDQYGLNATRAYLLAAGPLFKDADFEYSKLVHLHDSLIVDGFINMFFRCTGKKFLKLVPEVNRDNFEFTSEDHYVIEKVKKHTKDCLDDLEKLDFTNALSHIREIINTGNGYLNQHEFWKIKDAKELEKLFYIIFEITRILSVLFYPYIPQISTQILECLNLRYEDLSSHSLKELFTVQRFQVNTENRKTTFIKKLSPSDNK